MNKDKTFWIKSISLVIALLAWLLPYVVTFEGLSPEGHRLLGIFLMAIVLWVSEAVPLHATAALIILLEILTISNKALWPLPETYTPPAYSSFYSALAHPVLMLFLGGFFLAEGAAKYALDKNLARILLKPFGTKPAFIVLGLMLITALLSMFMSNTATTATMMAVIIPVLGSLSPENRLRSGLALSIPVAANVGGLGTPVGTPPNAIAIGALAGIGEVIRFLDWMVMMMPLMIITLFLAWGFLLVLFRSSEKEIVIKINSTFKRGRDPTIFYITFASTLLLWLTEPLHHMSSTVVGFIPVVVLLMTGVFTTKDMQRIQWHVLWLVAGGIALGKGVSSTGLDAWLIGLVDWQAVPAPLLTAMLCLTALIMSTVISNSASANLLIPIGISLAMSGTVALTPLGAALYIAVGCSLAMALPISTPPNAVAYSTGMISTPQMMVIGLLTGITGFILFTFLGPLYWSWIGIAL